MIHKLITWCVIIAFAGSPVVAQQPRKTPPTVIAPVTVVAPDESPVVIEKEAPLRSVQEGPVRVVQSGPVTFTFPIAVWIAWLVAIATGLGAIAVIWRFTTKAAKIVSDFSNYGSVLMDIAKEFKSDSGSTLKDAINRIEAAANVAHANALTAKTVADNLENTLRDHMALAEARQEVQMDDKARRDDKPARRKTI